MALIEIQHVVADMYPVDPDWTTQILEGMVVGLDANGFVALANQATTNAIGLAGDTLSNTTAATPYSDSLIINADGSTRQTENRVSDFFNETVASGKMTVYNGGGKFATDQYETDVETAAIGSALYASSNGMIEVSNTNGPVVGRLVEGPTAYPSGVPGTDTTDNSISLGDFATFVLLI